MKRHFGTVLAILVLVGLSQIVCSRVHQASSPSAPEVRVGSATGSANLQLVIEGPFVLCETSSNMLIAIPKLDGNHYPPGFSVGLYEYPLVDTNGKFPDYTHYTVALTHAGSGTMNLVSDGGGVSGISKATLYREHGNCNDVSKSASIAIAVPKPDEIWPLAAGVEEATVWGTKPTAPDSPTGNPVGLCKTGDCKHANKVVLRYLGTDLSSVTLTCDSGLSKGTCPPSVLLPANWTPGTDLVAIGQEAELLLDAQPAVVQVAGPLSPPASYPSCRDIVVSNNNPVTVVDEMREEEADAFCAATTMASQARYMMPTPPPTHPGGRHRIIATTHRDCKSAVTLICQNSATCP
jgi:hypothetical protein